MCATFSLRASSYIALLSISVAQSFMSSFCLRTSLLSLHWPLDTETLDSVVAWLQSQGIKEAIDFVGLVPIEDVEGE